MHTSGKVLAWFVVIGGLAAIYLSAKTLSIRNEWMKLAQKNEADILKNDEQILVKTRQLDSLRSEFARSMLGWDRYWPEVESRLNQKGELLLGLGTGYGVQPDQVLYIFAPQPDGSSKYLGDFRVTKPGETNVVAVPNWFRYAGQIIPGEYKVRVRTQILNQFQARLGGLEQQLLAADQTVLDNESELAKQVQLTEHADKLITTRLTEINGDPALEGKTLPDVNIKGLIAAMADEEEARNAALLETDRLLRELKTTRESFVETLKANQKLTESLPGNTPAGAAVGNAGR